MKRVSICMTAILVVLQICCRLWALPTTAYDAEMVVKGWLKVNPRPLGSDLDRKIMGVETITDDLGEPIYYVVYLKSSGYVIVSANDLIEPIIAFTDDGTYDPAPGNPLEALVTNDLKRRTAAVRSLSVPRAMTPLVAISETQNKWSYLMGLADVSEGGYKLMIIDPICDANLSDPRVPPLVDSKWAQSNYYDSNDQPLACYNYFTPQYTENRVSFTEGDVDNYPCGCVAVAMAQFLRYRRYPQGPVEPKEFTIEVDGREAKRGLLRGDGPGGAYNWDGMVAVPNDDTTDQQLRTIGAICHDVAIAIETGFTSEGSGASLDYVADAFLEAFQYKNAMWAEREGVHVSRQYFLRIFNCNLDAGIPVILGFRNSDYPWIGHAGICDGYGYNMSVLYHHLNMGWEGQFDCWYSLPDIAPPDFVPFDAITQCVYNIFTDCTGEIISGRIIDSDGRPFENVTVTAKSETDTNVRTTVTNSNGIYAFIGLESDTLYTITPDKMGHDFDLNVGYGPELNNVLTGRSTRESYDTGNRWGIDFIGYSNSDTTSIGQDTSTWDYPMHTEHHDSRTQVIYLASEIGRSGTIAALALDVAEAPESSMTDWIIRIKHTRLGEYTDASLDATGWMEVCRIAELDVGEGWQIFEFQTLFEYNGMDNLLVDFSHNNSSDSQSGKCRASSPGGMRTVYAQSNSEHGDPLDWSGATSPVTQFSDLVPNLKLIFSGGTSQVVSTDIKLTASDGESNDHFGCSVAMSGDYAIVGAYGNDGNRGAAYVFKREGTNWIEQAKLTKPLPRQSNGHFGKSVSISGDYAIIGSGNIDERKGFGAFVFKRNDTTWTLQNELRSLNMESDDFFGNSVSISGDYAIVGSPWDNSDTVEYRKFNHGSVSIFEWDGTDWIQQTKLFTSDSSMNSNFGYFVSISGDYAIATKDYRLINLSSYGSSIYILKRDGTSWTEQAKLTSPNVNMRDAFGTSISISGKYIVIGAPGENNENGESSGSVFVYEREGTNWTEQTRLIALGGDGADHFGFSVSISGDLIIVGSPDDDDHYGGRNSGSAYVFEHDGESWIQRSKLTAMDSAYDDFLGTSVAIDGDYALVGAPNDDDMGRDSGSVYVFKRIGTIWTP